MFSAISTKGNNFYDFLFAFKDNKALFYDFLFAFKDNKALFCDFLFAFIT